MRTRAALFSILLFEAVPRGTAAPVTVPTLPIPSWEGREVSVDVPLTNAAPLSPGRDYRVMRVVLDFFAATNNNVQIALGTDRASSPDGVLSASESGLIVGWDCGMWTLRQAGMRTTYTAAPSGGPAARRRSFAVEFRVRADGTAGDVRYSDGSCAVTFAGAAPVPDLWTSWTLMRATARGAGSGNAAVSAELLPDGTRILFR